MGGVTFFASVVLSLKHSSLSLRCKERQKWIENFGPKLIVIRLDIALNIAVRYSSFTYKALLSC